MEYNIVQDIKSIRAILGLTQDEFAAKLGVEQVTISRTELGKTEASKRLLDRIYTFAFANNIKLNLLKEMLWKENIKSGHKLLFHGAKSAIEGPLSVRAGRKNNDFGQGFYGGECYGQAISFVSGFEQSCVYFLDFDESDLSCKKYEVDQEWMLTIAYYRGGLDAYKNHPMVQHLVEESRKYDYIVAPIADNRMFKIINSFVDGEITDEQCKHCLAATNLGFQYVFISDAAIEKVRLLERCYISDNEKAYYRSKRSSDEKLRADKVKLARIRYRGQGRYIDEILA